MRGHRSDTSDTDLRRRAHPASSSASRLIGVGVDDKALRDLCSDVDLPVLGSDPLGPPCRVQLASIDQEPLSDAPRPTPVVRSSLIPLYAVGVFLAFTLSQAGMHCWRVRGARSRARAL
jgi:hypothetical protein